MPIATQEPLSDGWWLQRLSRKLAARQKRLETLDRYFRGDPPLPAGADNCRETFRQVQRKSRSNFAGLSVEALRERCVPLGFRTGGETADDKEARQIWDDNGLDVESVDVHEKTFALGDAYAIVGLEETEPVITAEDPRQVVTIHDPVRQSRVVAGLKIFHDDVNDRDLAYLYLPGRLRVAWRSRKANLLAAAQVRFSPSSWEWDEELSADFATDLADVVPVVRFRNKNGVGQFEPHIDLLDRINHTILQRMTIATLQAFRQRAIKVDAEHMPDKDPETGETIDYNDVFSADPGALWKLPATADMWESGQVDLSPILQSVKDDVEHFSAVTRIPMHYLTPGGENQSAEGAQLTREGLVFMSEDRQKRLDAGWSQVMALAFRFRAGDGDLERAKQGQHVIWMPAARASLSERASAASQATAAGVPWRTVMTEILNFTPEQVDRMESERADDLLLSQEIAAAQAAREAALTGAGGAGA